MKLLKRMRKQGAYFLSFSMLLSAFAGMPLMASSTASEFDYNLALKDSVIFYDANKCGKDVAGNNAFDWRSACHVNDGSDKGLDLTGGFHDCGDHVKFGINQNYAASVLGWSYLDYRDAFEKTGNADKMYDTLKYVTDYLLKCHPNANTFYYQIGSGTDDHNYWGAPELQGDRKVYYTLNSSTAGSDMAGGASAALSIMYLNSKDKDPEYAAKCLSAAKSLYVLGTNKEGIAPYEGNFYASSSYKDDLAWAATWLYRATNDSKYLADAEKYMASANNPDVPVISGWTMCWDEMYIPTTVELYKLTGKTKYLDAVKANMENWYDMSATSGGLKILNSWGSLRYSASASAIAMQYYKMSGDTKAKDLAMSQINYILGDNPNGMSYMIGFGSKYPTKVHHRAANGYQGYNDNNNLKEAKHVLTGALVGGPGESDAYSNDPNKYTETEVGIDYNAGLVMALAGIITNGEISTGGNTGDNQGGNTGDNTGDNQGGNTGDNTGDNQGGNTGDNQGGNTGDNTGDNQGGNTGDNTGDNQGGNTGDNQEGTVTGAINVSAAISDSWGAGYVMNISVNNNSTKDITTWSFKVPKADFPSFSTWNCNTKEEGNYIVFTPVSHNAAVKAGSSISFGIQGTGSPAATFTYTGTATLADGTVVTLPSSGDEGENAGNQGGSTGENTGNQGGSTGENTGNQGGSTGENTGNQGGNTEETTGSLKVSSNLNSWGSGYTCAIKVENPTNTAVTGWKVKVLKSDFNVVNAWNCKMTEEGNYVIFTPETHNQTISANGSVEFGLQGTGAGNADFWYSVE